jgi:hypothetical protein
MLNRDAMFSSRLSYPRAAYQIKVQLFLPNPQFPTHTAQTASANPARNEQDLKKKLLTTPPKGIAATVGMQRDRVIESPNLARLSNDMPITIQRRNPESGRIEEVPVQYQGEGATEKYPDLNLPQDKDIAKEIWV